MSEIVVDSVRANDSTLVGEISHSRDLDRFFTGRPFRTDYDVSIEGVPEAILSIPLLAHVCPVAWANGADVRAPVLDRQFARALEDVGRALAEMHPDFMEGGAVRAGELVDPDPERLDRSGLLFSGGVDSLASYVRHRDEDMDLISVRGWVIDDEDDEPEWQRTKSQLRAFATERGHDHLAVRSNMLSFLDTPMLQAHFKRYLIGSWYSSVGHGLGLLGIAAPLTYARDIGQLYMAATYPDWETLQGGSHPDVDDNVRWTGVSSSHDGHDLSRQEKLELIVNYVEDGNRDLQIRTCTKTSTGNCSRCEKCVRSMFGLLLSGVDPNDHGFEFDPSDFDRARAKFEKDDWVFGPHEVHMWDDLRSHYDDQDLPAGGAEFFRWLRNFDLEEFADGTRAPLPDRVARTAMRHTPTPVYARAYPLYDSLRRRVG